MDFDKHDENLRYYYDKADKLVKTVTSGEFGVTTVVNTYDKAGNLLNDGESTYTYDLQNRLLTQTGAEVATSYEYDKSGNLTKKTASTGVSVYEYSAQNRMVKGTNEKGETSEYVYNALGVRIQNIQIRANVNARYASALLDGGSLFIKDYTKALSDGRNTWQRTWETEVGTTVQNDAETVTKNYIVDYLSLANRDIMVYEEGSFTQRHVYGADGKRISTALTYAEGTNRGEPGENIASDTAVGIQKVWYRTSHLDSTLFAVDSAGEVITHTIYNPWGNPITDTKTDLNYTGLDNRNNYTGYTWDETLDLYFAQNRFYDAEGHRFTQEDPVKDGGNWYGYVGSNPLNNTDHYGWYYIKTVSASDYFAVPEDAAITALATFAKEIPVIGGALSMAIQGVQNYDSIGGSSDSADVYAAKAIWGMFEDSIEDTVKNAVTSAAEKVLKDAAKGASGVLFAAISVNSFLHGLNTALQTPSKDRVIFKLFELAGIEPRGTSQQQISMMMAAANQFIEQDRWFFIDAAYENVIINYTNTPQYFPGSTLFSILMRLNTMKSEGKSLDLISKEVASYSQKYACATSRNSILHDKEHVITPATLRPVYVGPIAKPSYWEVVPAKTEQYYYYAIKNYQSVLNSIASNFRELITGVKGMYTDIVNGNITV